MDARRLSATLRAALTHRRARLAAACVGVVALALSGALTSVDHALSGWRAEIVRRAPTHSLVIVEIDPASLRAAKSWPWPRAAYADAITNLREAGAGQIGFDVDFGAQSSSPRDDAALAAAVDGAAGEIVLPTFVQRTGAADYIESAPLAALAQNAVFASVNIPVDRDGKVRRYVRGFGEGASYRGSMAAVLAGTAFGANAPFLIDYGIRAEEIDRLSFEDVRAGNFDPARVRGKAILVGATALELGDEFATPTRPTMSGVVLHALAYESLVQGRALVRLNDIMLALMGVAALLLLWPRAGPIALKRTLLRHGAVFSGALLAPIAVQAFAPVSLDVSAVLSAQLVALWFSVQQELARRAEEIVRQRERYLDHAARHDPETELQNRRAMLDAIAASDGNVLVAAIGIDRFAILRGAIGYGQATDLVRGLAVRLGETLETRHVYHLSTSILGVILDGVSREALASTVEKLAHVNSKIAVDGVDIEVGLHVGAILVDAGDAEHALERATIALDEARLQNRTIVHYEDGSFVDPKLKMSLISGIRPGIERGEFSLLYQPKTSTRDGSLRGVEALARWTHPEHGVISPDQFIAAAEETGAIAVLTRWALERAIADQADLLAKGVQTSFSVNLSARCLVDEEFCAFAIDAVKRSGAWLYFEITETAIIDDPRRAIAAISDLQEAGIRISIDDYGAGLSSLSYLKRIDADELKLDKGLVEDVRTSLRDRLILKSTIDLAHSLGLTVVAEGVEDESTRAVLATLNCDLVQGYLVSPPVSCGDLLQTFGPATTVVPLASRAAAGAPR